MDEIEKKKAVMDMRIRKAKEKIADRRHDIVKMFESIRLEDAKLLRETVSIVKIHR